MRGLRVEKWGRGRYLSDMASELAPESWLLECFPQSGFERVFGTWGWVDTANCGTAAATTYALAMALLWDDPAEAVSDLLAENAEPYRAHPLAA